MYAPQYLNEYCTSFSDTQSTVSSLSQPSPSFCATSSSDFWPSLLLVWRRGTLYLTIYIIRHVTIVILDIFQNLFCSPSTSAHSALEVFLALMRYINLHYLSMCLSISEIIHYRAILLRNYYCYYYYYYYYYYYKCHGLECCPLTKLNGGLSRLHSADEDAVSWLTNYGKWHAYEKKKTTERQ